MKPMRRRADSGELLRLLSKKDVQIRADGGVIRDGEDVFVLPLMALRRVDYFHGFHGDCAICQDEYEDDWPDYEMVSSVRGPLLKAVRILRGAFRVRRHARLELSMFKTVTWLARMATSEQ